MDDITKDSYAADNYTLTFSWDQEFLAITKIWPVSNTEHIIRLEKTEAVALMNFIDRNVENESYRP